MSQPTSLMPLAQFLAQHPQLYSSITNYYSSVVALHRAYVNLDAIKSRVLEQLSPVQVSGEALISVPTATQGKPTKPSLWNHLVYSLAGIPVPQAPTSQMLYFRVEKLSFCSATLSLLLQGKRYQQGEFGATSDQVEKRIPLTDFSDGEFLDSVAGATPLPYFSLKQRLMIKELIAACEQRLIAIREQYVSRISLKEQPQFKELVATLCPFKVGDYVLDGKPITLTPQMPIPAGARLVTYVGVELEHLNATSQPRLEFKWLALGPHVTQKSNGVAHPAILGGGAMFSDLPYRFTSQCDPAYLPSLFAEFYEQFKA